MVFAGVVQNVPANQSWPEIIETYRFTPSGPCLHFYRTNTSLGKGRAAAGGADLKLEGKAKMLQIHFGKDDKWHGRPRYEAMVAKCRELNLAGARACTNLNSLCYNQSRAGTAALGGISLCRRVDWVDAD